LQPWRGHAPHTAAGTVVPLHSLPTVRSILWAPNIAPLLSQFDHCNPLAIVEVLNTNRHPESLRNLLVGRSRGSKYFSLRQPWCQSPNSGTHRLYIWSRMPARRPTFSCRLSESLSEPEVKSSIRTNGKRTRHRNPNNDRRVGRAGQAVNHLARGLPQSQEENAGFTCPTM